MEAMSRIKFKCKITPYGVFLHIGRNASDMRLRRHILARINRMRRPGDTKRPSARVYWLRHMRLVSFWVKLVLCIGIGYMALHPMKTGYYGTRSIIRHWPDIVHVATFCSWGKSYMDKEFLEDRFRHYDPLTEDDLNRILSGEFLFGKDGNIRPDRIDIACYIASFTQIHDVETIRKIVDYAHSVNKPYYIEEAFRSIGPEVCPVLIDLMLHDPDLYFRKTALETFGVGFATPNYSRYWAGKARNEIESVLLNPDEDPFVRRWARIALVDLHDRRSLPVFEQFVHASLETPDGQRNDAFYQDELNNVWDDLYEWGGDGGLSVLLGFLEQKIIPQPTWLEDGRQYFFPNPDNYYELQYYSSEITSLFDLDEKKIPYFYAYRPIIVSEETYARFERLLTDDDTEPEIKEWLEKVGRYVLRCPDDKMDLPFVRHSQNMSNSAFYHWDARLEFYKFLMENTGSDDSMFKGRLQISFFHFEDEEETQ